MTVWDNLSKIAEGRPSKEEVDIQLALTGNENATIARKTHFVTIPTFTLSQPVYLSGTNYLD